MNLLDLDKILFNVINLKIVNEFFDFLMPLFSNRGYLFIIPFLALLLWQEYKNRDKNGAILLKGSIYAIALTFFSFILADWLANEIKYYIARPRPCIAMPEVRLLAGCTDSFSMPSNHSANSFAILFSLLYYSKRLVPLWAALYLIVIALFVMISRVYVGVHYPSDIVGGAFIGFGASLFVIILSKYTLLNKNLNIYRGFFFFFLFALSIFRIYYISNGPLNLSPDEAHYWEWSRRLDLSYYSKGPMIAYLIYIGTSIFGDNVFGIRLMAVLFSILSSLFLYRLIKEMYDNEPAAAFGSTIFQIIPLFAPFGIIFSIDSPFIFFWILSLYIFWNIIAKEEDFSGQYKAWILLGAVIGMGLLTKYTMVFFFFCGFLFLLFSEKRYLLKTFKPYLALSIALIIFSPVIIWNMQNDWVSLKHTVGHTAIQEGFKISFKSFGEFLGSQIGVITPIIFFMSIFALFRKDERQLKHKFLISFSVPIIAFFTLKSLQGKVQANWPMHGYITAIIAFSAYYLNTFTPKNWKPIFIKSLTIAGILMALALTAISHYPSLINLPVKLDPTSRLRGWNELGHKVGELSYQLSKKGAVIIFSDSYQISSQLAFYVKGKPTTYCINLGRRMNQYDLWEDIDSYIKRSRENKTFNAIFVRMGDTELPKELSKTADSFEKIVLTVYDKKNNILRHYTIFICYNFKGIISPKPFTF